MSPDPRWRAVATAVAVLCLSAGVSACSDGGGGGDTSAFCNEIKSQRSSSNSIGPADEAAALDKLTSLAPSEIKTEMAQLRDFNDEVTTASNDPTKASELDSKASSLQSAVDKVTAFVKDKCGIDLNATSSQLDSVASSIN